MLDSRTPPPTPQQRRLASLETPANVKRELAKLYADYHHRRIETRRFTQGVYALNSLRRPYASRRRRIAPPAALQLAVELTSQRTGRPASPAIPRALAKPGKAARLRACCCRPS